MPFCENCGTKLSDTAKFCPNCGHKAGDGDAASAAGQTNPVAPAPNELSKEEIIRYLAVYAKELLSLQEAVRRLFPADDEILKRKLKVVNENGSLVLDDEESAYGRIYSRSCVLLDWSKSPHLQREEILNQLINDFPNPDSEHSVIPNTSPLSKARLDNQNMNKLPQLLVSICKMRLDEMDSISVLAVQEKLKTLLSRIGDVSNIFASEDVKGKDRAYFPEEVRDVYVLSSLDRSAFSSEMKAMGFKLVETLWKLRMRVLRRYLKKYEEMPGFFTKGRAINLADDSRLCSAFDEFLGLFFWPNTKSFAVECLSAACDAIEERAREMDNAAPKNFNFPLQYRSPECAVGLARLLLDGKADTWKEAMVLFDTEKYRETVIQGLGSISGQIALLNQQVKGFGAQASAILGELKTTNIKLSSISTSTFITAVFGDD